MLYERFKRAFRVLRERGDSGTFPVIKGKGARQVWLRGRIRQALHQIQEIDQEVFGIKTENELGPQREGQGSGEKKFADKNIPIMKCFIIEGIVQFWCPFCRRWHHHYEQPDWPGYRVSYCRESNSPLKQTGYYIKPYSEGELKRIREKAEG